MSDQEVITQQDIDDVVMTILGRTWHSEIDFSSLSEDGKTRLPHSGNVYPIARGSRLDDPELFAEFKAIWEAEVEKLFG